MAAAGLLRLMPSEQCVRGEIAHAVDELGIDDPGRESITWEKTGGPDTVHKSTSIAQ